MNDLCIGGGGYSGLSFIGCLEYLDKNKLLDLKNFYGTSIGSLIGVAYICNIKPIIMLNYILKLNFQDIVKYDFKNLENFHLIDDTLLDNLINLLNMNENITTLTLKHLYDKTNVNINIYTTNIDTNKHTCFNNIDTPNIKVYDAIKASMSIPFLFKPVLINNESHIDGCCKNIVGLPPSDIYICGYTIIIEDDNNSYINKILNTILNRQEPRSTFVIKCERLRSVTTYMKLNKIDSNFLIEIYKHGIESARKYCI